MLPDVDRGTHGGRAPWNHRGLPHSLLLAGGVWVLIAALAVALYGLDAPAAAYESGERARERPSALAGFLALGGASGYLSHLLLDSLTPKRVWLLLPGGRRVGWGGIRAGSSREFGLLLLLVAPLLVYLPPTIEGVPA
jgi:membrane-bound metal-dependent hydrolase YbcI (DUF457 family)